MRSIIFLLFATVSCFTIAGTGSGKIINIYAHEKGDGTGVIFFETENNTNKAACSANGGKEWAFRVDTDQGKAMYSLLLAAASTGRNITVNGKGDCDDWGDRERPKYIRVSY
ncbi:hypothetical protein [Microbulbifer sp. TYP-18]|uniref:hypothetical protein n=1 Tax=Microbulbifer sp. TYP-18 TaxID=3230024 RepID=UPI0034C68150